MPFFSYSGRNSNGDLVKGLIESADSSSAADQLISSGVIPVEIQLGRAPVQAGVNNYLSWFEEGVTHLDVMMFSRQMHTLLKAGIPIMNALAGLQASTSSRAFAEVIRQIRESLDSGRELSATMRQHAEVFSTFYASMIRVGESTGMLDGVFLSLYRHMEFEKYMREQIRSALRYPTFVIGAMLVAVVVVNIFVIPAFAKVFKGLNAELPLLTRLLVAGSDFFLTWWPLMLLTVVFAVIGFLRWINTEDGRFKWDEQKLRLPIAGKIVKKATMARFARGFALAARSGMPIVQGMTLVAETVDNAFIQSRVEGMREGVGRGESILRTAVNSGVFSPLVLQMIAVGEESGMLEDMMQEVADMYQQEVEYEIKTLGAQIEPVLIIVLGVMVLILALGVFLPIWDLGRVTLGK